jgi:hypothetical protein
MAFPAPANLSASAHFAAETSACYIEAITPYLFHKSDISEQTSHTEPAITMVLASCGKHQCNM